MAEDIEKHQHHLSSIALRTLATSNTLAMSPMSRLTCGAVSSPITTLTLNLSELSTGRGSTPRRKLSLSNLDTPSPCSNPSTERSDSTESGCFVDSPTPLDSPTLEMSVQKFSAQRPEASADVVTKRKTMAFRRFSSMPMPMMRLSPDLDSEREHEVMTAQSTPQSMPVESGADVANMSTETFTDISPVSHQSEESPKKVMFYIDESSSQDSGFGCDRDSRDSKDSDDGFEFAAPQGMPPVSKRQMRMFVDSEDTCSPFKYSPVKEISPSKRRNSFPIGSLDFSGEIIQKDTADDVSPNSPLKFSRLTSVDEGIDDGFRYLEVMDDEVARLTTSVSTSMSSLFSAPVISSSSSMEEDDDTPVSRRTVSRRFLHRSQSVDIRQPRFAFRLDSPDGYEPASFKRDPPQDESTPVQKLKRRRPASIVETSPSAAAKPKLHRCHSASEAMIKSALNRQADEPDLIGDCSKSYCLPTLNCGKHQDLKSISSETLTHVLDGHYSHEIEKAIIVDCRYPYEFSGGHIEGALNLYTNESIIEKFLKHPIQPENPEKRVVLVFHCEFSSERGPKLSRFLRKQDRQTNKDYYPHLAYPELYLLDGGYKSFFESQEKTYCIPAEYKPMLHKEHSADLRHFRTKSKSWTGGEKAARSGFRPLKF